MNDDMKEELKDCYAKIEFLKKTHDDMADEIERLQAECWRMKEDLDRAIGWRDRDYDLVQELKAQVHELKTALKQAANALDSWGGYVAANNARAALEGKHE